MVRIMLGVIFKILQKSKNKNKEDIWCRAHSSIWIRYVTDVMSVSHNAMVEVQREWLVLVGGGILSLLYFLKCIS